MKTTLLAAVALAAAPLLWASEAEALDKINMGNSSGTMPFTSAGGGEIKYPTATFSLTGASFTGTPAISLATGKLVVGASTTQPESAGVFPLTTQGASTFQFTGSGNTVSGTVLWGGIKDNTTSPQFDVNAVFTVTSVSGTNAAFLADFKKGSQSEIDFTLNTPITLTTLAGDAAGTKTTGTFSSGEVVPIPEPTSLTILGSALAALGWVTRRRRNQTL